VVKNKIAAPFKQAEFDLVYNEGISRESEMLAFGEKYQILQKSGSAYTYTSGEKGAEAIKLGRGYDSARVFLKENKQVAKEILKQIEKKLREDETFGTGGGESGNSAE